MVLAGAAALAVTVTLAAGTLTAAAAATPPCTASGLDVWLNSTGSGTAGATYYALQFTNVSGHECTLSGYPGVSAVNSSGKQIGAAAIRNAEHKVAAVTLASFTSDSQLNDTGIAIVRITDTGVYSAAKCGPTTAVALRVYAPGQKASSLVPFPFTGCSKSGANFLSIEALEGGVGAATG